MLCEAILDFRRQSDHIERNLAALDQQGNDKMRKQITNVEFRSVKQLFSIELVKLISRCRWLAERPRKAKFFIAF